MPLRAVVYQADLLNQGRNHHHSFHSFFGGSFDDQDCSYYDPSHILNSQAQNCSYANLSNWPLSMFDSETDNVIPSPNYNQKRGSQRVGPRRRRFGDGATNEEVMHHQRLTHIAVERHRRKQVNEYISTIRSLMPNSYASKGDQASIVEGAINFVKELEQKLQWLESHGHKQCDNLMNEENMNMTNNNNIAADVEVSVAECFADLKIRVVTGPVKNQLLLRILEHLDECKLTVLHLNVSSVHRVVLYTICMKVEEECNLTTGDEIAAAVHRLLSTRTDMG